MISDLHWPHNESKSATFGDFSGLKSGLPSRYLPERQLWRLLLRLHRPFLKALEVGGHLGTQRKPIRFPRRPEP